MQPAARDEDDLVTGGEGFAEDRFATVRRHANGRSCQFNVLGTHEFWQHRRLAAAPGGASIVAGSPPTLQKCVCPITVDIPVRGPGGEVGVHNERESANAAQVVDYGG